MPRLAVNVSDALYAALDRGLSVDYIKVPLSSYPENRVQILEAKNRCQLLLHPTQTGVVDLIQFDDEKAVGENALSDLIMLTQTPSLSVHLAVTKHSLPSKDGGWWTGAEVRQIVVQNLVRNCERVKSILTSYRPNAPFLLENHSFWPDVLPFTCDPEFLNCIARKANAKILLDLAHARVTAFNLGLDIYELLSRFDLENVGELHLSGPKYVTGLGMVDAHCEMSEEDFEIFAWTLKHTKPSIVSLEYGGMTNTISLPNGTTMTVQRNDTRILESQARQVLAMMSS